MSIEGIHNRRNIMIGLSSNALLVIFGAAGVVAIIAGMMKEWNVCLPSIAVALFSAMGYLWRLA